MLLVNNLGETMNTPQSGIIPQANSAAYFLCLNIKDLPTAKQLLLSLHGHTEELSIQHRKAKLSSVIGLSLTAWEKLIHVNPPDGLEDFECLENTFTQAPSTQFDLLLHIRSERHDLNFELAKYIMQKFSHGLVLSDEVSGFRYLDNRDLTGFVDGTENPQTEEDRRSVALAEGSNHLSQGSFIHAQRYIHNLPSWQPLPLKQQEDTIGRSKLDNIEYPPSEKPHTSHIKRAGIKREDGSSVEVLRHSMPYGNTQENGLFFISYSSTADSFPLMLRSMILGDAHGNQDHLLKHTAAVTGAAFYAPPIEFLCDKDNYR